MRETVRAKLSVAKRVVVKVGTRVLVDASGRPDEKQIKRLVDQLARLHSDKIEVVLVTSGAIGAGMQSLGWQKRPKILAELQMAAAVGQTRLMSAYEKYFAKHSISIGQVLLTYDDLRDRVRHLNARNSMNAMLRHGVVPVVNENDVVSVDEIKVGDNDVLAALVTALIGADLLILLSSTDGLKGPGGGVSGAKSSRALKRSERVPYLSSVTEKELSFAFGKGSDLSTGGMASKLRAAGAAARSGALVVIADGRDPKILSKVIGGADVGTLIGGGRKTLEERKRWISMFHRPRGSIVVDAGAVQALEDRGRSLLPSGIKKIEGAFTKGSTVNVEDSSGDLIARGLVEYSSTDLEQIVGKKSSEIAGILGAKAADEVIHRDNLVLLRGASGEVF